MAVKEIEGNNIIYIIEERLAPPLVKKSRKRSVIKVMLVLPLILNNLIIFLIYFRI